MTEGDIQKVVVRLFEESRQAPGAPFEDHRFMAFLTAKPESSGTRHTDSFNGCRRYSRFIDSAQLELGVCFNNKELDRGYSLGEFAALIRTKMNNPAQTKRLAGKRLRETMVEQKDKTIIWSLVITGLLATPFAFAGFWVRLLVGAAWAGAVLAIFRYHSRRVSYAKRLIGSISDPID